MERKRFCAAPGPPLSIVLAIEARVRRPPLSGLKAIDPSIFVVGEREESNGEEREKRDEER